MRYRSLWLQDMNITESTIIALLAKRMKTHVRHPYALLQAMCRNSIDNGLMLQHNAVALYIFVMKTPYTKRIIFGSLSL